MSLTAHRILQYIALILIFTAMAGGYWYWKSQAAVRINQGLEDSLEQGLVGYWKLDDASGTTATDSSGNGNNGTLTNGPTWSTGQVGGAVTFDGTDDAISIPDANVLDGATFTVSLWTRSSATGSHQWSRLISKKNFYNSTDGWEITMIANNDTHLYFSGSSDTSSHLPCVTSWSAGAWHHVVAVYSGSSAAVYCDGSYKGNATITPVVANSLPLVIGDNAAFNEGKWQGGVDETRIYNRSLSDEEVKKLYQTTAPQGIDTGLVGYWPFDGDDFSGTTTYDRSGKGNHGSLVNGPSVIAGKIGQALNFWPGGTDTNAHVNVGDPASGVLDFGSGDFAVGFWMKSSGWVSQGSSVNIPFSKSKNDFSSPGYLFKYSSDNKMKFTARDGTTDYDAVAASATTGDGQWHHYVGQRSGSTIYIYIDGSLAGSSSVSGSLSTTEGVGIGDDGSGYRNVNGSIDEVRVYNRALTAADVQDLYQKTQSDTVGASNKRDSLALGLTGYWKLDDASGTTATDSSTNGNTGSVVGTESWTSGRIDGAFSFNGTNAGISLAQPLFEGPITFSAWVYGTDFSGRRRIIGRQDALYDSYGYGVTVKDGIVYCMATTGDDLSWYNNLRTTLSTNEWHLVTCSITGMGAGQTGRLYVDGTLKATYVGTAAPYWGYSVNSIGYGAGNGGGAFFAGKIDEARIYNRPLSDDEVKRLYLTTAPTGVDTGLKGYWSFDGPSLSGTTVSDWSGAINTGTSSGGPVVAAGPMGQALQFDGVNDCVSVPDAAPLRLSVGGKMSISLWYKSDISSGIGALYQKIDGSTSNQYAALVVGGVSSHTLTFYYRSDGAPNGIDAVQVPNIEKGVWHHVISTYDTVSGVFTVFVDGVSVKTMTVVPSGTGIGSSNVLNIGSGNGCAQNFTGQLDEFRIYNRILSIDEVREAYDYGKADKINTAGSDPLTDGLAGYWKLDDASGTTATDSSGNGNNGTLTNGPTWTAGQVQGAVNFDGTNDYINIPSITAAQFGNTTFTFAGWIKTTGTDKYIAAQDGCNGGWGIRFDSFYKVFVETRGAGACGSYAVYRYTASAITPNEWHHIAAVIKTDTSVVGNNTINIYIDGVLNQDTPIVGSSPYGATGANGLQISGRYINDLLFSGPMDELRLYNRGLSSEEVQKLYRTTAPTGIDTGLVGYWSFDGPDVAGTTAYDRSGKGNHGSLVNGPSVIAGKIGQALSFWPNGSDTNAHVNVGDPASGVLDFGSGDFAVGFWMKSAGYIDQSSSGNMPVSKRYNDNANSAGYVFRYGSDNKMSLYVGNGTSEIFLTAPTATASDNQWHHYAGQRSGGTVYLYVDGVQAASDTLNGSVSNSNPFAIGSDTGTWRNVQGPVDEVRVYNRALTTSEIQNLYNKGR